MAEPVVIPQGRWLRRYVAGFGVLWFVVMALFWVHVRTISEALVALFMSVYGGFVCYRVYTARVETQGDVLLMRNYLIKREIQRSAIESFRIGMPTFLLPVGRTITIRLRNGRELPMDVTLRVGVRRGPKRRQAERLAALEQWREAKPAEKKKKAKKKS